MEFKGLRLASRRRDSGTVSRASARSLTLRSSGGRFARPGREKGERRRTKGRVDFAILSGTGERASSASLAWQLPAWSGAGARSHGSSDAEERERGGDVRGRVDALPWHVRRTCQGAGRRGWDRRGLKGEGKAEGRGGENGPAEKRWPKKKKPPYPVYLES